MSVTGPPAVGVYVPVYRPSPRAVSEIGTPPAFAVTVTPAGLAQFVARTVTGTESFSATVNPGLGDSSHVFGDPVHVSARPALSRPSVVVTPTSEAFGSTVRSSSAFSPAPVALGKAAAASAAVPATCGDDIEVPVPQSYPPPRTVE